MIAICRVLAWRRVRSRVFLEDRWWWSCFWCICWFMNLNREDFRPVMLHAVSGVTVGNSCDGWVRRGFAAMGEKDPDLHQDDSGWVVVVWAGVEVCCGAGLILNLVQHDNDLGAWLG